MRLYENAKGESWSALRQVQHLEVSRRPEFCVCVLVTQSCPTLCNLMDWGLPGSSVHGESLGKNTGVGHHALLQGIFPTQGLD